MCEALLPYQVRQVDDEDRVAQGLAGRALVVGLVGPRLASLHGLTVPPNTTAKGHTFSPLYDMHIRMNTKTNKHRRHSGMVVKYMCVFM